MILFVIFIHLARQIFSSFLWGFRLGLRFGQGKISIFFLLSHSFVDFKTFLKFYVLPGVLKFCNSCTGLQERIHTNCRTCATITENKCLMRYDFKFPFIKIAFYCWKKKFLFCQNRKVFHLCLMHNFLFLFKVNVDRIGKKMQNFNLRYVNGLI